MTFYVHFDDSGTHAEGSTAVAACWVSTIESWRKFATRWDSICAKENLGVFHMADFASAHGSFSHWPESEKLRVLDRLCDVIDASVYAGFAYGVIKKDYEDLVSEAWRKEHFGEKHYTYVLRQCIGRMSEWRRQFYPSAYLYYIFDRMGKGKKEIIAVMDAAVAKRKELKGYGFQSRKEIRPLQAADIFAWTTFQCMQLAASNRPLKRIAAHLVKRIGNFSAYHRLTTPASREGFAKWIELEKSAHLKLIGAGHML